MHNCDVNNDQFVATSAQFSLFSVKKKRLDVAFNQHCIQKYFLMAIFKPQKQGF